MTDFIRNQTRDNDLINTNSLSFVNKKKVNLILPNDTTTISVGVGPDRNSPTEEKQIIEYKYTGDMYAEKKHGKGVLSYSDGRVYRGAFFADKRHGFGDYYTPDKSEFKGLYCHDERFGPGILSYKSVDIADVGLWLSESLIRLLHTHPNLQLEIEITDKKSSHSNISSWYSPEEILTTISNYNFLLKKRSSTLFCNNFNDKHELLNNYLIEHMDRIRETMHDKYAQLDAYLSSIDDQQSVKDQISKERQADIIPPNQTYDQQQLFYFINKFWPLKQRATFSIDDLISNIRSSFPSPGPLEKSSLNLFEYSFNGDENQVRDILMERSVYVDVCDCHGLTSLHFSVYNGHIKVLNTLLDFGANVNQLSDDGLTALSLAFLLYYGNNPQQTRNLALEHSDPIILNPRPSPTTESNSLFLSRQNFIHSSSYLTNDSNIQDEIKLPSSSSPFGQTSDFQSKSSYGFELTNDLRERIRDEEFRQKIFSVILILLRRGADPTYSDWPLPVLALAVRSNDEQMVKLLLKKKAQVNCQLNSIRHASLSPLHIACGCLISNPAGIVRLLLEHQADVNIQSASGNKEYLSLVDPLVIESNKINLIDDNGRTPMHIACSRDESQETLDIVKVLLEYNANPNAVCNGQTPLTLAIILGNESLVNLLLNCERTDPATVLGFGNGNALCLLLSTFFEPRWLYQKRLQLIERLIVKNPKVLYPVRFGPKNLFGSCVDFGHYMFNSDTRISQTPYHALSMEERAIYGERKDLLGYMAKRFREEVTKCDGFLRLLVPTFNVSGTSTPNVLSRVPSIMIKEKSSEFLKPTHDFRYCATCGRGVGVHLSICKRCQKVSFCSKSCKVNGWNQFHRYECKRVTSSTIKNSPSRNRELSDFDRILTFKLPSKTLNANARLPPVSVSKYLREKRLRDRIKSAEHPPTKTIDGIPLSINPIYRLPENYSFN